MTLDATLFQKTLGKYIKTITDNDTSHTSYKNLLVRQYIYIKTVRLSSFFYDELNINRRPSEKKSLYKTEKNKCEKCTEYCMYSMKQ